MFTQLNQYHVVLEVDPQFRDDPDSLKSIYVPSANGQNPATPGCERDQQYQRRKLRTARARRCR